MQIDRIGAYSDGGNSLGCGVRISKFHSTMVRLNASRPTRTGFSTKPEQQPRLTASSESLPYWQPENFADAIWVLQSSLAVTM